jgi:hypothetical protein
MDKACGDIAGRHIGHAGDDLMQQDDGGVARVRRAIGHGGTGILRQCIIDQRSQMLVLLQCHQPLETADADMAMRQAGQNRRTCRAGFIPAMEMLAGFHHAQRFGRVGAQGFEHFGRQNFAHRAFQRQTAIALTAPWRGARTLGAKVEQAARAIAHLGKQETAPVAQLRIINPELMPVIAQRQRLGQIAFQRLKPAEMVEPCRIVETGKANGRRMALITPAQSVGRKPRRFHRSPSQGAIAVICGSGV